MKIERPRGTRDFLPDEMEKRRKIEGIMRRIAESYGYREIATPTFEHVELFTIKSGESIVEEMYVFEDKSGRKLALRPELTAPVMRMYVNECEVMPKPLRFYYFANCFRYERPQRGRYREFWQFGVELIGSDSYLAEAEVIALASEILSTLNIDFELEIGHVGIMRKLLSGVSGAERIMRLIDKGEIEEAERRMVEGGASGEIVEKVLRLVELKGDASVVEEIEDFAPSEAERLRKLSEVLELAGVDFRINLGIARGLDYYTGVVFECYAEGLGAQKQICGGGSYELAHLFGGSRTPATGFAIGFDRVCEVCSVEPDRKTTIVVVSFGDLYGEAVKVAQTLRRHGFAAVLDVMGRSVKKQLSFANDINADFAVIVGRREIESGKLAVKDLKSGEQVEVEIGQLTTFLSRRME